MLRAVIGLALLLAVLLLVVWIGQRRLIYFPFGGTPRVPDLEHVREVSIRTADGVALTGWFFALNTPAPLTVIVCNGNAGNREHRVPFALALRRLGVQVLLFDYRGFGGQAGSPSHSGLLADARAAREAVLTLPSVTPQRLVYFGESLGAAVAAELAAEHPPAALVLRSPFTSLADVGQHHYPFLPVRWLLRDRFSVVDHVARLRVPTLVIAGDRDSVVPIDLSRRVYEAAAGPKQLVIVPGADHNDASLFTGQLMMNAIGAVLQKAAQHPDRTP